MRRGKNKKKKAWANWYWNVLVVASYFWLPASQLTFALLPLFMRLSIKKCGYFPLQSSHYYEKVICLPYFHNNLTGRDSILVNIMHCLALATVCFWIFSSFFFFFVLLVSVPPKGSLEENAEWFSRMYSYSLVPLCQNHDHIESFKIFLWH